jgi:hypothetical protein
MNTHDIWLALVRSAGGRQYPHLQKYLNDAPVEVWHDLARLVRDFTQEAMNRGKQEARHLIRSGRVF